ncbi:keratin, type I cytoskeletal 10-like [Impatiens glandulifera]|uniref:keratin, type I cytoskeletal 10-like n=1 Tax=Impatiens glandulifera TaxID=253017 RepID=UPI001FB0B691|nr:keratin, type I cytoskeletal 10-like [Impatiens glandulifera]
MGSNMVKILKTQKEDRKEFAEYVKILKELDNTLKKNTYETHVSNLNFSKFEKQLFSRQSEMMSLERQINLDNHREVIESMELFNSQMIEIQGEPNRRGDGVSTNTRSKRAPTNDENPRPTKRGRGRSGGDLGGRSSCGGRGGQSGSDRGGRTSGGNRDGRSSGSGRGGRALPPFQNLLIGEGIYYEGTRFPIDPRVKRGEQ